MQRYRIFRHPAGGIEAVKQGWSWPGLFFTVLWAFAKRLWSLGGIALGLFFVLALVLESVLALEPDTLENISRVIGLAVSLLFGLRGNIWRENNLLNRGYAHVQTVSANNPESAIAQFLQGRTSNPKDSTQDPAA